MEIIRDCHDNPRSLIVMVILIVVVVFGIPLILLAVGYGDNAWKEESKQSKIYHAGLWYECNMTCEYIPFNEVSGMLIWYYKKQTPNSFIVYNSL